MFIKRNIGSLDRLLRIVVGLILIALGVFGVIGWWGLIGLIPLLTAFVGFCPLYPALGINTCKNKTCEKKEAA